MTVPNGEFGGVVVRSLRTAGDVLPPGHEISAEDACSWPIANRVALANSGQVRWHSFRQEVAPIEASVDVDVEVQEPEVVKRGRPRKENN